MALDIAGGSLNRLGRERWQGAVEEIARQVRQGSGFGELRLPGDEQAENRVEAALFCSYDDLPPEAQARFRWLGACAADASFQELAAAMLWECPLEEAQDQLAVFQERALVTRLESESGPSRWQQHTLLRAYALALAGRAAEEQEGRRRQAAAHLALMRDADDRQVYHLMLPDYPQLRHAFSWAIENDLWLAQGLAGNTANLQAAFFLAGDKYAWAGQLLQAAQRAGDPGALAAAQGMLGNAYCSLPTGDRAENLRQAIACYQEALTVYTPQSAPREYAMVQRNLADTHLDLGELEAAAACLGRAAELQPDSPRLAELRQRLEEARRQRAINE